MRLAEVEQSDETYASDGMAVQRLTLCITDAGLPVLRDHCGTVVSPWEIELLQWPAAIEADLRRGGYLNERHWHVMEPWCNCVD
jgi:hypothetical protein